ncbi:hypothetical protein H0O02_00315 [Candidatus Micrarchaeota archaeon]|nr:hypothetical protein [Candidatus Micrarchaeota archaeon]
MGKVIEFPKRGKELPETPKKPLLKRFREKLHGFMESRRIEKENETRIAMDAATIQLRTAKILVTIDCCSNELLEIANMTGMRTDGVYEELLSLTSKGIVEKERGRYRLSNYGKKLVDKLEEDDDIREYAERYDVI